MTSLSLAATETDERSAGLPVSSGNLLDFPEDPIQVMRRIHREHGHIGALEQNGFRLHFVFGPQWNHRVLTDVETFHSRFFAVRGSRQSAQRRLTSGLLSMNGKDHKQHRRMVMGAFLKKAIEGYLPTIKQLTGEMLNDWRPGQERDLSRDMTEFMLRVTSTMLFGVDDVDFAYQIGRMIDEWVQLNHELGMGLFVSRPEFSDRYEYLLQLAEQLEADITEMIQRNRQQSAGGSTVLSMLLGGHDEGGELSTETLVGQSALIFAAAHLTTAHSLTWTLFLLAQHPSAAERVFAELQTQLVGDFPTLEQVDSLKFTERAIKESMRVLPASSYSQRMACQPTQLGPFELKRGDGVIFSQFVTHHLPEIYEEPEAYLPQRWERLTPSPYAYLPFGAGPRMCVGGPLAMTILKTVVPAILQRFRLTVVPGSDITAKVVSTMLTPIGSVPVRVDHADGRFCAQPVAGNIEALVDLRELPRRQRRAA